MAATPDSSFDVEIKPEEEAKAEETNAKCEDSAAASKPNFIEESTDARDSNEISKGNNHQDIRDKKPKEESSSTSFPKHLPVHAEPIPRKDDPPIYQLQLHEKYRNGTFTRYTVGSPSLAPDPSSERVLMLVGATGTGKTTLLNGIANYIYGTKWEDNYRVMVVHKEGRLSQAFGQTKQITAYTFPVQEGSPLPYTLTVIDTPGFGDSDGLKHDSRIVDEIKEFFSLSPPEGIESLQGIGFVVKASDGRLTPMQSHIFNSVLGIFGKDVEENLFIIITFDDGGKALVIHALKEAGIPVRGTGFRFNNSALFNIKDDDGDEIDYIFRKGMKNFRRFFEQFEKAIPKSVQQSKKVLEERKHLQEVIQELKQQVVNGIGKLTELAREEEILRRHEEDIEANKEFTYTVIVTKQVRVESLKERVTNCVVCDVTCHRGCVYNKNKHYCKVMKDKHCTVCRGRCHYRSHVNQPFYYETQQTEETRTSEELKRRFKDATERYDHSEKVVSTLKQRISDAKEDILIKVKKLYEIIQQLSEISLNTNHMSETDYISLCIAVEKQEVKPGWQERIQYFESLLRDSKFIATVSCLPHENLRDIREKGLPNQSTPVMLQAVPNLHARDRVHSFRTETMYRLAEIGGHISPTDPDHLEPTIAEHNL
jgi:hypothetical protein